MAIGFSHNKTPENQAESQDDSQQSVRERIKQYNKRLSKLKTERASWLSGWKEIAEYIYPWMLKRLEERSDRQADIKTLRLENSAPAWAINVLAAGLASGMTPQSRKWFRLSLPDGVRAKDRHDVKQWLHEAEEAINEVLHRSNAYDVFPALFMSLSLFGTAALYVDSDEEDGVRFYMPTNGSYVLANSGRQSPNTFMREIRMTVAELVDRFGLEAVTEGTRNKYKRGELDTLIDVVHVIEPNPDIRHEALAAVDTAPFRGVFFERAQSTTESKFLQEDGYFELPVMAARWELFDGDVYGYGPGHKALGDCKDLKLNMRTQARLLNQLTTPPIMAPLTLKRQGGVRILPGEITYYDPALGAPQIAPIWQQNPHALAALINQEEAIKQRINQMFFVDVFLAISQAPTKSGVTATEIIERYQEKLLMLGPVLERVNNDLLDPMIKRVFWILYRAGRISPPPEEIANTEFKIEYVSAVALGQQATTVTAIEALTGFIGNIAGAFPDAIDLFDTDSAVRTYASLHDLPPSVIRSAEVVEKIRADRAKQDEMMQQAQQAQQIVDAAKTMSQTDTSESNLLTNTANTMAAMTGFGL